MEKQLVQLEKKVDQLFEKRAEIEKRLILEFNTDAKRKLENEFAEVSTSIEKVEARIAEITSRTEKEQAAKCQPFSLDKPLTGIKVKDILGLRERTYDPFYLERPFDQRAWQSVSRRQSILIVGDYLAGKTRAILELVHKLEEKYPQRFQLIIPALDDHPTNIMDQVIRLKKRLAPRDLIFVFDDIDQYLQRNNTDTLLKACLQEKCIVIATCRSGYNHYDFFRQRIEDEVLQSFRQLMIEQDPVGLDAMPNHLRKRRQISESDQFDDVIGARFLPVADLRERYEQLTASSDPIDQAALLILKVLKALYLAAAFSHRNAYPIHLIRNYGERCLRSEDDRVVDYDDSLAMLQAKFSGKSYTPKENPDKIHSQAAKIHQFSENWDSALAKLTDETNQQNFLRVVNDEILIDDFYLKVVVAPCYDQQQCVDEVNRLFPAKAVQKHYRLFRHAALSSAALEQAKTFADAEKLFRLMVDNGVIPNLNTYSAIISRCPNFEKAEYYLGQMIQDGLKPNADILTTMIRHSPDFARAHFYCDAMKADDLLPDAQSFDSLIILSPDLERAKFYCEAMKTAGFIPNESSYNAIIRQSLNFDQAKIYFDEMVACGLNPDVNSYTMMIKLSPDYEQARFYFEKLKTGGLSPNETALNALICKSSDFMQARCYFEEMKAAGFTPSTAAYSFLVKQCPDHKTRHELFLEIKQKGLIPEPDTYAFLIERCHNFQQADAYYQTMKADRIRPNHLIMNALLQKARREPLEVVFMILEEMLTMGVLPSSGRNRRTGQMRHYTREALTPIFNAHPDDFAEWTARQSEDINHAWQQLFSDLLKLRE